MVLASRILSPASDALIGAILPVSREGANMAVRGAVRKATLDQVGPDSINTGSNSDTVYYTDKPAPPIDLQKGLAYELTAMQRPVDRSPLEKLMGGEHGFRYNSNQPKGSGWLGNVQNEIPRGPVTEYSLDINGRQIPSVTPGLNADELNAIVKSANTGGQYSIPNSGIVKALKFADERARFGYGPFKD